MSKFLFSKGNKINNGRTPWNKGTKGLMKPNSGSFGFGQKGHTTKHTEESKKKMSDALKKTFSDGRLFNRPQVTEKTKDKIRHSVRKVVKRGEDCHFWNGGTTTENQKARSSFEMSEWRRKVFTRDNYTCRECGVHGKYIEAHHIKSFSKHPELRFEVDNGLTVCLECHCKIDKFRARSARKENKNV